MLCPYEPMTVHHPNLLLNEAFPVACDSVADWACPELNRKVHPFKMGVEGFLHSFFLLNTYSHAAGILTICVG